QLRRNAPPVSGRAILRQADVQGLSHLDRKVAAVESVVSPNHFPRLRVRAGNQKETHGGDAGQFHDLSLACASRPRQASRAGISIPRFALGILTPRPAL